MADEKLAKSCSSPAAYAPRRCPDLNKLADMALISFQLYLWPQRLLVLGPAFAAKSHRHHAAQIALGLDGPVVFETPQAGLHRADALLIPPDTPHAHPAYGAAALLYLEPEGIEWAHLSGRGNGGLALLPFDRRLRAVARRAAAGDAVAARSLAEGLIGEPVNCNPAHDALVTRARELIGRCLDGQITLAALARAVHRSPGRLAHRFRNAIGVPLRRYVLWCRVRAAAEAAMHGSSLTEAAHAAGFSDSAHLSRTFRSMFGIAPSLLFKRGRVRVTFLDNAAGT
jgi:AraC-like DNA-binding protein